MQKTTPRYVIVFALFLTFSFLSQSLAVAVPPTINIAAGESIQKAIDAAPDGTTLNIAAGTFPEHLIISKPLTLIGAGPDKTILKPNQRAEHTPAEKDEFFKKLDAAKTRAERMRLAMEIAGVVQTPTIDVRSADGVMIKDLKIQGVALESDGRELGPDTLVTIEKSRATMNHCAVVGPFMNGVSITAGCDVLLDHCLVAGMWGTGVQIYNADPRLPDKLNAMVMDCDIRNCYSRCVTINCDGAAIEKCRISGSAWHGIRYDDCSPVIAGNRIIANARFGIYASGKTAAVVRDNVFSKNEMSGMGCWFDNADAIENNTFADNVRAGIEVLGASKPSIMANTFVANPVAIDVGKINGDKQNVPAAPTFGGNTFWNNKANLQIDHKDQPNPAGSKLEQPKAVDSPVAINSPWPIQPEETAMVPETDTRDYAKWKTIAAR